MWFFNSPQSILDSGILEGFTDFHTHLLPGVDDGVKQVEETIRILRRYESWGIKEVWMTPHIMEDYPNTTHGLREKFAHLLKAYHQVNTPHPLLLHLGSENMLDSFFMQRLQKDDLLPIIDGKHLLVETSYFNPPMGLYDMLQQIKDKGYTPILAHPERYNYMSKADYRELKELGVKMQLNLLSLYGGYGEQIKQKSVELLKKGYYHLVGSDIHHENTLEAWGELKMKRSLYQMLRSII